MVEAVDNDGPPPQVLRLAWLCGDGLLPDAGGVMDQDYQTMVRMRKLSNIYDAFSHFRGAVGAEIHSLTDNERRIIATLQKEGLI